MTQDIPKLKELLGDKFEELISQDGGQGGDTVLSNSKEIYCTCKTLVLRSNHARLVVPNASMLELEKSLVHLNGEKFSKNLVKGCYWLVDDMYKFEQISYTKEIDLTRLHRSQCLSSSSSATPPKQETLAGQQSVDTTTTQTDPQQLKSTPIPSSLRYLACAECNLCPIGWFDSNTKESYLYVWW